MLVSGALYKNDAIPTSSPLLLKAPPPELPKKTGPDNCMNGPEG